MKTDIRKKIGLSGMLLLAATLLPAQSNPRGQHLWGSDVRVTDISVSQSGGYMTVSMNLCLDSLQLPSNQQFVYTPSVRTEAGLVHMPQVVVNGRKQHIMHQRGLVKNRFSKEATVVRRHNGTAQTINYVASVPFTKPQANYDVLIHEDMCGCGDSLSGTDYTLRRRRQPIVAFMKPEAEAVKVRHLDKRAYIDFPVNKITLYPDYRRNPAELDSIVNTINMLKEDRNLTVSAINIHGFASPESPYKHNDYLAENRARTLKEYVCRMVQLDEAIFTVSHTAEDWEGLRRYLSESNIDHKQELLAIASDENLDPDVRELRIKQQFPQEYRFMLDTWYPALRHSDYHITYQVKPFDVEEAKALIFTKPQQLSQQEMFLVAQTYEPGSKEFSEVMETAVRMYPDNETANLNAACSRLNRGMADAAKPYLDKAGNSPQALNARGIYESLKGNLQEARRLFEQAAKAGVKEAAENLQNTEL